MNNTKIYRCTLALTLASLGACTGLKDVDESCTGSFLPIHEVQGDQEASPMTGERVTVRGVVVGDFQQRDQLAGFFLQDPRPDDNSQTSEGIFIHATVEDVTVGDLVQVSGRVKEYSDLTELADVDKVAVCHSGTAPAPITLTDIDDLEPYEGMLVAVPSDLTVAGSHELNRLGQLLLTTGGRPFKRTDAPHRQLLLDDGRRIESPETPPYLDATGTRRVGDTLSGLVGVIAEQEGGHVLHPTAPPRFTSSNPRAAAPQPVEGTASVASFNLLNFFTTLGQRGATDARQLSRQRAKHVVAISRLDADVVGLSELENNGELAIRDLVQALNAAAEPGEANRWAHVPDPAGGVGDDAIRVGLIYRPSTTRLVGPPKVDRDPVFKRPPFAQTFETEGERFTVVVNHFKSKSCRVAEGAEADAGDGQGCWNPLRVRQARRVLEFVGRLQAESGDTDVLVIGDLNAYGGEDPIRALTDGGLIDLAAAHVPSAERYSYVYRGESGYLDHALATPSLSGRVTGATFWHINADEPPFLDYRAEPGRESLNRPNPFRSSDHDPVLIGFDF